MTITNMFGDLANDYSIKNLINKFGRFSFTAASELRTSTTGTVAISSGTVTTVTTGNIGFGDQGKASAAISNSANMYYNSVRRNFV